MATPLPVLGAPDSQPGGMSFDTVSPQSHDSDAAANLVSHYESGNRNIPNYRYDPTHTASGYFQITNTNWQNYAPKAGIDLTKYPSAISAPYDEQKTVFNRIYADHGFAPWANYNPRLAEALGSGRLPTLGWTPSPIAFKAEENKSNSDVRYMSPEEYLDLLPSIENNEQNKSKRLSLQESLSKGDNIESLPSLDVRQKGNSLHVVDWDGRNRAQAAIDSGADEIPVAIRGVSKDNNKITHIIGADKSKTKLPYSFVKVPPSSAPQEAQKIVPEAFPKQNPALSMEMARSQNPALVMPPSQPGVPTAPQKPDFYPEIVAGINKDIISPERYGYRGVGVPNPVANATPGQRIANANATSSGRIGVPQPSFLSQFNPIGSAQAAEAIPSLGTPDTSPVLGTPDTSGLPSLGTPDRSRPPPMGIPGLDTIAPPLANAMMSLPVNLAGDVYGALAGQPRWAGGLLPTKVGFDTAKDKIVSEMTIPESPFGQFISQYIIGAPGNALRGLARAGMSDEMYNRLSTPASIALDVLGLAGPMLGNHGPTRAVLGRVLQTPEMRAARAINRRMPAELKAGGPFFMGQSISLPEMRSAMAEAWRKGVPLTLGAFSAPGGPQEKLFSRSLEHYPEARAETRNVLNQQITGMKQRLAQTTDAALGTGSAYDQGKNLDKSINVAEKNLGAEQQNIKKIDSDINARTKAITKTKQGRPTGITAKGIAGDPQIKSLTQNRIAAQRNLSKLQRELDKQNTNKIGLDWGQSILKSSVRTEDIRDFLRNASNEAAKNLRLGAQDALKQEFKNRPAGAEPLRITTINPENRQKVLAAFGGSTKEADRYLRNLDYESQVAAHANNVIRAISKDSNLSLQDKQRLLMLGEAGFHLASGLAGVGHVYTGLYWLGRAGRHIGNMLVGGGGLAPRTKGTEIARIMNDPNVNLATSGNNLLNVPARPSGEPSATAKPSFSWGRSGHHAAERAKKLSIISRAPQSH